MSAMEELARAQWRELEDAVFRLDYAREFCGPATMEVRKALIRARYGTQVHPNQFAVNALKRAVAGLL